MEPLISVIIPVYNVEKYLTACLESVVNQTYQNLEVILIDDGSKDASGLICDQYAERDHRIRVIHQENSGVAAARNVGLRAFTGEFVMFVDSDDTIALNSVQVLCERALADGSELVIAKHVNVLPDGTTYDAAQLTDWMKNETLSLEEVLRLPGENKRFFLALWGKLFRKTILTDVCVPNLSCGEDAWIFPEYISRCNKISIEETPIYFYRARDNSITRGLSEEGKIHSLKGNLRVLRFYLDTGHLLSAKKWFEYLMIGAASIKNKARVNKIFSSSYKSNEIRSLLEGQPLKVKVKWISLYFPIVYKIVRGFKDILGMP